MRNHALYRMAVAFVRLFLEVECGNRDRRQLAPLIDPLLFAQLEPVWVRPGPPRSLLRVGGVQTAPGRYDAIAVVRRGERVGALSVRFSRVAPGAPPDVARGRWIVSHLTRPEDGLLPPPTHPPLPDDEEDSFEAVLGPQVALLAFSGEGG